MSNNTPEIGDRKIRVLLAEDHPLNLRLVSEILSAKGWEVTKVNDGAKALAQLQIQRFDVVILDYKMPGLSGTDVVRHLRKSEEGTETRLPAVALTAFVRGLDREQYLRAGFDACLEKPFQLKQLVQTVQTLVAV